MNVSKSAMDKWIRQLSRYLDPRYSTYNLVHKLAEIFAIPSLVCDKVIEEIELKCRQSNRFLAVDEVIWDRPLNDQLEDIQEQIEAHYRQQPVIDIWGEVKQHIYYYKENLVLVFSTSVSAP